MKKIVPIILSLVLSVSILSGCNSSIKDKCRSTATSERK